MRLATVLLAGVLVAGCGSDIDAGYITKKVYHQPWNETQYDCYWRDAKTGICNMQVPRTIHHAAEWEFKIREDDQRGYVYVDETTWHQYEVGQHFPDPR